MWVNNAMMICLDYFLNLDGVLEGVLCGVVDGILYGALDSIVTNTGLSIDLPVV